MLTFSHTEGRVALQLRVLFMGQDMCVLLDGGEKPHVGAVAVAHGGEAQYICLPGHKEEDLAHNIAIILQKALTCTVTCICGIHISCISKEEIALVYTVAEKLVEQCLQHMQTEKACVEKFSYKDLHRTI